MRIPLCGILSSVIAQGDCCMEKITVMGEALLRLYTGQPLD